MTTPLSGKLAWGQAGNYDAIEDRTVIAALAGRAGLVIPPTLTARTGLAVEVGAWRGIADCGDNTMAVIGSREAQQFDMAAGGATQRTDVLFADIDPDAGTWAGRIYAQGGEAGRLGLLLGTIIVPAGANSSGAMTLTPGQAGGGVSGGGGSAHHPPGNVWVARANQTNFQPDPHLRVPGLARAIYALEAQIIYSGAAGGGSNLLFSLASPTGTEIDWHVPVYLNTARQVVVGETSQASPSKIAYADGVASANTRAFQIHGTVYMGAVSGPVEFWWAQGTANNTTTRVWSGSRLSLVQIG